MAILRDFIITEPVVNFAALTAIPTTNMTVGVIAYVIADMALYSWNGSSWTRIIRKTNSVAGNPSTDDDSTRGYEVLSLWLNNTTEDVFICVDATSDAAVWKILGDIKKNTTNTNPTATDDNTAGYEVFSLWLNTSSNEIFICYDATTGAAVWNNINLNIEGLPATAPSDNQVIAVSNAGALSKVTMTALKSYFGGPGESSGAIIDCTVGPNGNYPTLDAAVGAGKQAPLIMGASTNPSFSLTQDVTIYFHSDVVSSGSISCGTHTLRLVQLSGANVGGFEFTFATAQNCFTGTGNLIIEGATIRNSSTVPGCGMVDNTIIVTSNNAYFQFPNQTGGGFTPASGSYFNNTNVSWLNNGTAGDSCFTLGANSSANNLHINGTAYPTAACLSILPGGRADNVFFNVNTATALINVGGHLSKVIDGGNNITIAFTHDFGICDDTHLTSGTVNFNQQSDLIIRNVLVDTLTWTGGAADRCLVSKCTVRNDCTITADYSLIEQSILEGNITLLDCHHTTVTDGVIDVLPNGGNNLLTISGTSQSCIVVNNQVNQSPTDTSGNHNTIYPNSNGGSTPIPPAPSHPSEFYDCSVGVGSGYHYNTVKDALDADNRIILIASSVGDPVIETANLIIENDIYIFLQGEWTIGDHQVTSQAGNPVTLRIIGLNESASIINYSSSTTNQGLFSGGLGGFYLETAYCTWNNTSTIDQAAFLNPASGIDMRTCNLIVPNQHLCGIDLTDAVDGSPFRLQNVLFTCGGTNCSGVVIGTRTLEMSKCKYVGDVFTGTSTTDFITNKKSVIWVNPGSTNIGNCSITSVDFQFTSINAQFGITFGGHMSDISVGEQMALGLFIMSPYSTFTSIDFGFGTWVDTTGGNIVIAVAGADNLNFRSCTNIGQLEAVSTLAGGFSFLDCTFSDHIATCIEGMRFYNCEITANFTVVHDDTMVIGCNIPNSALQLHNGANMCSIVYNHLGYNIDTNGAGPSNITMPNHIGGEPAQLFAREKTPTAISSTPSTLSYHTDCLIDPTTEAYVCNLPSAVGKNGQEIGIKNLSPTTTNSITLQPNGAETIDGAANLIFDQPSRYLVLCSDNANWYIK